MPSSSWSPSRLRQASFKFFFICQSGWASTTSTSTAIFIIIDDDDETGSSSKPTRILPKTNTSSIPISDKAKYEAEAGFYEGWVLTSKAWSSGYAGVLRLVMLLTYNGVRYLRLLPNSRCTTRITTTIITSSKLNIFILLLIQYHHLDMIILEWCMLPLLLSIHSRRRRLSIINRRENPRLFPQRCWVNMDHHHLSSVQYDATIYSSISSATAAVADKHKDSDSNLRIRHYSASYRATPTGSSQTGVAACGGAGASNAKYQKQNPYRYRSIPPHQPQHHQLPLPHMSRYYLYPAYGYASHGAPGTVGMERSATPTTSGEIGTTISGSNGSNSNAVFGFAGRLDGMVHRCNSNSNSISSSRNRLCNLSFSNIVNFPFNINNFSKLTLNLTTRGPGDLIQLARWELDMVLEVLPRLQQRYLRYFWRIVCCRFAFKYVFLVGLLPLSWQYFIHVMHNDIFKLSHSGNSDVRYNYKYSWHGVLTTPSLIQAFFGGILGPVLAEPEPFTCIRLLGAARVLHLLRSLLYLNQRRNRMDT